MYKRLRLHIFIVFILFGLVAFNAHAAKQLLVNNVATTLATDITTTVQTVMVITSITGFPSITGGDWIIATLVDSSGNKEIVKITAMTGATCTIVRGQESTSARTFLASGPTIVSLRLTKGTIERYESISELLEGDGTDLEIKGNLYPDTGGVHDIGATLHEIKKIYTQDIAVSGALTADTIAVGELDPSRGTSIIAYPSTLQDITSGVTTIIEFNSEIHDALGEFNTTTHTFTPLYSGRYIVSVVITLSDMVDNVSYLLTMRKNAATDISAHQGSAGTTLQSIRLSSVTQLEAGQEITFAIFSTGTDFTVINSRDNSRIGIHRLWD